MVILVVNPNSKSVAFNYIRRMKGLETIKVVEDPDYPEGELLKIDTLRINEIIQTYSRSRSWRNYRLGNDSSGEQKNLPDDGVPRNKR